MKPTNSNTRCSYDSTAASTGEESILSRMSLTLVTAVLALMVSFAGAAAAQLEIHPFPAAPASPIPTGSTKSYLPASVLAFPGSQCLLHRPGSDSKGLPVFADDDGYVRFYAVRATPGDAFQQRNLECTDSAGKAHSYSVDLASDDTFVPRPVNPANERGTDRPALTGDPLSYSETELIQAGYGPRPDPEDVAAYSRWLAAATVPARMLEAGRPTPLSHHTVTKGTLPAWTGSVLKGAPNYISSEATYNIPTALPYADETTGTWISIWNGLGGVNFSGLIQGGVDVRTEDGVASYVTFREYCCGDGVSNNYSGNFVPNPGDSIYSVEWYCDSQGNLDINGGYGCTHLHDLTNGDLFSCTSSTGSPCPSAPELPLCSVDPTLKNCMVLGQTAEFIIELASPQLKPPTNAFTPYTPEVTMAGDAYSSKTKKYSQSVSNDPLVERLVDFTDAGSHMNVSLGKKNQTYFSVSQFEQTPGAAHSGYINEALESSEESIAVGPNANGSSIGDAWMLGESADANGNYQVYQWQDSAWVKQPGHGIDIAISPGGDPWLVDASGKVFFWNRSAFDAAPTACATWIAVGPNAFGSTHGDPWIIGCSGQGVENANIYQLQASTWVKQPGLAWRVVVSPEGTPWAIDTAGNIYFWKGSRFVPLGSGCATAIAVGPSTAPLAGPLGDVWITGCTFHGTGYDIHQLQFGTTWADIPGQAVQISVSPDLGVPWVVNNQGNILK
jgi:hypothetical protein